MGVGRRAGTAGVGAVLVAAALVVPRFDAGAVTAHTWTLTAPGGTGPTATVSLSTAGRLTLSVREAGATVLGSSALGVRTSATDLSTGLTFATRTDSHVTDTYPTMSGRRRQHSTDGNRTTLSFTKGTARLDVIVQVEADGLGFRYVVHRAGSIAVTGEATEFAVPPSSRAFLLPYDNGRNDYEAIPVHTTVSAAKATEYGYPSLFQVGSTWLLLTESDANGGYGASRVTLDGTSHHFTLTLPDSRETGTDTVTTPWRTLVTGSLGTVVASDLVTDLATPSKVADTSWIKPGRSEWSWWSNGASSRDLADQEKAVDFAAKMGWEYVTVDAGWDGSWVPTLVKYARARNVGVFIWTNQSSLATASSRNSLLPQWKSWGVVGLKIDFIESDGQQMMQWYDAVLAATAKNKLMVEFHGCTIPRGTERTWPQVLTSEAVEGAEHIHNKPGKVPFPADYYTTLPLVRNLAGSMDYTPVTFTALRTNSDAAELAQSIVFESGLQNYADSTASYDAHPLAERLLKLVPTAWDDTVLLSGDPDTNVVLARRNGTNWYVGAITAGTARTVTTPLSFLATGTWLADVYSDGSKGLVLTTQKVTSGSTLSVKVPTNGGFSVVLCPARPGATTCG
jgi:alpha-glucosidase